MQTTVRQKYTGKVILSLFLPFWSFILSLKDFRSSSAKAAFFVFCVWIGAIFIYNTSDAPLTEGTVRSSDSSKTAWEFVQAHSNSQDFATYFANREFHDQNDFFQVTSIYFLSRITGNPRIWFLYVAIIFAFFYVNNTWYILQKCKNPIGFVSGLLIAFLMFTVSIFAGLNATRMNLAIQIFIFGLLPFVMEGEKKTLWVTFLCLLVHFSMLLPVLLLLLYLVLPKKSVTPYLILFFISFFIKELNIGFVNNALSYLPLGLDDRFGAYTEDSSLSYEQNWRETSSVFYMFSHQGREYMCLITMAILAIFDRETINNTPWKRLLIISLLIYIPANIVSSLPSGYRFLRISNTLLLSWILLTYNNHRTKQLNTAVSITLPIIIYTLIWNIRSTFDYLGLEVLWGNFVTTMLIEDNTPISAILGLTY